TSSATSLERVRSGPDSPPPVSRPWQKAQCWTNKVSPALTSSAGKVRIGFAGAAGGVWVRPGETAMSSAIKELPRTRGVGRTRMGLLFCGNIVAKSGQHFNSFPGGGRRRAFFLIKRPFNCYPISRAFTKWGHRDDGCSGTCNTGTDLLIVVRGADSPRNRALATLPGKSDTA